MIARNILSSRQSIFYRVGTDSKLSLPDLEANPPQQATGHDLVQHNYSKFYALLSVR